VTPDAHSSIEHFLDYMWRFPVLANDRFLSWEDEHPPLVDAALGDPFRLT